MKNLILPDEIASKLKKTPEQEKVVGPLVQYLTELGWELGQMIFGRKEWRVPKTPSEATKREKKQSYDGFPCDIAVFDSSKNVGSYKHLLFMVECKQPNDEAGVSQLEQYLSSEPYSKLGIWANSAEKSAATAFVYRQPNGNLIVNSRRVSDFPRLGEKISLKARRLAYKDLIEPSAEVLKRCMEDLLDRVVVNDNNVTRREEQLDQLCNILLLKLEGDKEAKVSPDKPPFFRSYESADRTAEIVRKRFANFVKLYPEVFTKEQDKELRFDVSTISHCVEELGSLKLIDLGVSTLSLAFQVLRTAALKQGEGQYFTPQPVIEAGIRLLKIGWEDIIIDPACGTGGFLVETMIDMERRHSGMKAETSRWAQTHIFGIDKDSVGVKLTKAIMQIAGDGSAHCYTGDSVRVHNWNTAYPHLTDGKFKNGRFTVVVTNPPFGANLKVNSDDARLSGLDIAKGNTDGYQNMEIGILFLQRAYQLLQVGGRLGIVLPETYFFSPQYKFLFNWVKPRFKPKIVANIPMEAFQGFCRAKTNFYVFEKIK